MVMDIVKSLGEISLGSRLKRLSDMLMKQTSVLYQEQQIDFDPYLFPAFYNIVQAQSTTNTQLKEALQISQPAVTQTINKLTQRGLITLKPDTADKRKKIIKATKNGHKLFAELQPIWAILEQTVKEYTTLEANTLVAHITHFEEAVKSGDYIKTVRERIEAQKPKITDYNPQYKQDFYDLNLEWLNTYFYVEDYDREVLSKPEKYILEPGGHIFFAVVDGEVLGTVALMKIKGNLFELTKMAVSPKARGKGIGQLLMQHCIWFAKQQKWPGLMLYSNRILENAIHIYRKYGFKEIPMEANSPYSRGDIKMHLKLD